MKEAWDFFITWLLPFLTLIYFITYVSTPPNDKKDFEDCGLHNAGVCRSDRVCCCGHDHRLCDSLKGDSHVGTTTQVVAVRRRDASSD